MGYHLCISVFFHPRQTLYPGELSWSHAWAPLWVFPNKSKTRRFPMNKWSEDWSEYLIVFIVYANICFASCGEITFRRWITLTPLSGNDFKKVTKTGYKSPVGIFIERSSDYSNCDFKSYFAGLEQGRKHLPSTKAFPGWFPDLLCSWAAINILSFAHDYTGLWYRTVSVNYQNSANQRNSHVKFPTHCKVSLQKTKQE